MNSIFDTKSIVLVLMGATNLGFLLKKGEAKRWKGLVEESFPWVEIELIDMEGGDYLPSVNCAWEIRNPYTVSETLSRVVEIPSLKGTSDAVLKFIDDEIGEWQGGPRKFRGEDITGNIFRGISHEVWEHHKGWFEVVAETEPIFVEHLVAEKERAKKLEEYGKLQEKYHAFDWSPTDEEVSLVKKGEVKNAIESVLRRL